MKLWLRLTLVCCLLLGLFLGLTRPATWYQLHNVSSGLTVDRGQEAASDSSTTSVFESLKFDPARAASLPSIVLDRAVAASNTGPPGRETHGDRRTDGHLGELPIKPAAQNNNLESKLPTQLLAFHHRIRKSGFRNTL